nr:hypothetical protein Iba_chr07bCG2850 [Ipomoea batatas]GMD59976.1 hypothetical protein Iba_scaffold1444598CG0010 [Ipomoea batatas]
MRRFKGICHCCILQLKLIAVPTGIAISDRGWIHAQIRETCFPRCILPLVDQTFHAIYKGEVLTLVWPGVDCTSLNSVQQAFICTMLQGYGGVGAEFGVAIRDEAEVCDGYESSIEELWQIFGYESGAVWAQGLIVEL